jgi:4-amino-4-deoxy-L-arabinose transferase-like glycosyltransferase
VAALGVLGVALAARVIALIATRHLTIRDDSSDYVRLGLLVAHGHGFGPTQLAAGGGPTAFRGPLYPLFLGAVFRLTGDSLTAARALQAVLGTVTVGLIGIIAWRLFDLRHALVAAALAAVYPPLILVANGVLTESISLPLELGALAAALECRHRQRRRRELAVLSGLLVGLAILTRPANGVLLVPAVLLLLPKPWSWRGLTNAALAIALVLVALAPWQIRNQRAFHHFVPVSTVDAFILAGVYNDQAAHDPVHRALWRAPTLIPGDAQLFKDRRLNELTLADGLRRNATSYATHHPGYIPTVLYTNFKGLFGLSGQGFDEVANLSLGYGKHLTMLWDFAFFLVAGVAVVGAFTRRARSVPLAVWSAPLLYVLVTVPSLGTARYRAPIEPFVLLLAAAAPMAWLDRRSPAST